MVGYTADGPARDRVLKLIEEKDGIENQIREHNAVLASNNVGMHDPLVDDHGYPRNDIDVYKVRLARHQIICLQNDHNTIMKRIEQGLAEVHAQFLPNEQGPANPTPSTTNGHMPNGHITNGQMPNGHISNGSQSSGDDIMSVGAIDQGFAIVGSVHNGSPADSAGLCEQDEVLQFGSINPRNFTDVSQILNIVTHSIGQNIRVLVRRNQHILNLTVTPRPWAQPGLLGCQILRRAS